MREPQGDKFTLLTDALIEAKFASLFASIYEKRIGRKIFLLIWKMRGPLCFEYISKIGCNRTLDFWSVLDALPNTLYIM